ncbi:MND1-interacting protein 1-like [Salvia divinorum]|uniref:MND1-interacting protein 1-like n=1 Tax=Salvia divinorum TaxID=28513 RepID=A0ABD1H2Q4_SALDI
MGGSKGGKHSKGEGKSKSMKNETNHTTCKHGFPKTSYSKARENELEKCLLLKLEDLYTRAKNWLLTSGYDMADVERAILHSGYVHGPKDLMNNVLTNTMTFIKQKVKPQGKAFEDMKDLYEAMLQDLIDNVLHTEPNLQRSEAMRLLLARKWGSVPSTSRAFRVLREDDNSSEYTSAPDLSSTIEKAQSELNIESSSKKAGLLERINNTPALTSHIRQVPILRAYLEREMTTTFNEQQDLKNAGHALIEGSHIVDADILTFLAEVCVKRWQESNPNDLKTEFIIDLMKSIRDLEEKVKVQKKWAHTKVIDSAKRLSKDLLELKMLKLEKVETQCLKDEIICAENSYTLLIKETQQTLRNVNCEANVVNDSIKTLEVNNARIRASIEALRLSASEYGSKLNQVQNREVICMKKLATFGKQTSNLRANCDEEQQKLLQLQQDVLQAEKESKEAEDEWKQEIREKEQMKAIVANEAREAGARKASLRAELVGLRQDTEIAIRANKNDIHSLEQDLSRLRMFYQMSNVSLEGDRFLYNGIEVKSLERNVACESLRHWICMKCSVNEVSVVFLPCSHQVLCAPCYEGSCSSSVNEQRCPYCGAEVEQCIKAYGAT